MAWLSLGEDVQIDPTAEITADFCFLGDRTVVGKNVIIEGNHISIGKEGWLDRGAHIGGGSCNDPSSCLIAGDFLHMGMGSHINIARQVTVGDEVGVGRGTQIFTHGAYLSGYEGFPVVFENVTIGDRVWLPHAWVNPGVVIGNDVVVAAMTVIPTSMWLPSGGLYGGIPCKVLKKKAYPNESVDLANLIASIIGQTYKIIGKEWTDHIYAIDIPMSLQQPPVTRITVKSPPHHVIQWTMFDIDTRTIVGGVNLHSRALKNQLRRNGIRFRYKEQGGEYVPW